MHCGSCHIFAGPRSFQLQDRMEGDVEAFKIESTTMKTVSSLLLKASVHLVFVVTIVGVIGAEKEHSVRETPLSFTNGPIVLRGTLMSPACTPEIVYENS